PAAARTPPLLRARSGRRGEADPWGVLAGAGCLPTAPSSKRAALRAPPLAATPAARRRSRHTAAAVPQAVRAAPGGTPRTAPPAGPPTLPATSRRRCCDEAPAVRYALPRPAGVGTRAAVDRAPGRTAAVPPPAPAGGPPPPVPPPAAPSDPPRAGAASVPERSSVAACRPRRGRWCAGSRGGGRSPPGSAPAPPHPARR